MRIRMIAVVSGLALAALGCGATAPQEGEVAAPPSETMAVAEGALTYRYCSSNLDCGGNCMCDANQCVPNGFGPANPDCGAPPVRECTTGADCRSGCICSSGTCQSNGFSPPNPYCHLPPPDAYEYDNTAASFSSYTGTPQTGHNFHELGDEDWVAVYFGVAGAATFETYNLRGGADTYIEVYTYAAGAPGTLVASNNDVCTIWYHQPCKASKVTVNVPADSGYYVRVRNLNDSAHNVYNQTAPGYDLRIYY